MHRLEPETVDHQRAELLPPRRFESSFVKAPESALHPGSAIAPLLIELMVDTLGFIECGCAILDRHLNVLHLNARIRQFFGNGLTLVEGRLSSIRRSDQERMTKYFHGVISGKLGATQPDHEFVHVPRRDQLPLIVRAHSVSRSFPQDNPDPLGIVLVTDPEHSRFPKQSLIQLTLGLSYSEARMALALINGASLVQVAQRLGVSHETARTHLKSVFAKTNTNRQSELVVLLNRMFRLS